MRRNHPDEKFVYIAVYKEYAEANGFKIIPIHPLSQGAAVYDYTKGMAMIDWETMNRKEFDDAHCKLVCLAECMSPTSLKSRLVLELCHVLNNKTMTGEEIVKVLYMRSTEANISAQNLDEVLEFLLDGEIVTQNILSEYSLVALN